MPVTVSTPFSTTRRDGSTLSQGSPLPSGRNLQTSKKLTRLSDITWDLIVARRREAQLRNQFLKTVLRLAESDRLALEPTC